MKAVRTRVPNGLPRWGDVGCGGWGTVGDPLTQKDVHARLRDALVSVPILVIATFGTFMMVSASGDPISGLRTRDRPPPPRTLEFERIVETASADELFSAPAHPYTQALISAIPLPDPCKERARERIGHFSGSPASSGLRVVNGEVLPRRARSMRGLAGQ
jgi:oligopeptide/dipeptide ABC transporter ATP-binding protein